MGHIGQLEKRAIVLLCAGPALLRPFPGAEPGRAAHLSDGAPDLRLARDVAEAELPGHIPRHGKQTASGVVHRLVHHPATVQAHAPAPGRDTRSKGGTARRVACPARTVAARAIRWSLAHGGPSTARGPWSTSPARAPRTPAAWLSTPL